MNDNLKPALSELVGTFTLVFIGAGAGALAQSSGGGIVAVAFAHGLALMVIIYALGAVGGGHVNPAVTFSIALGGKMSWVLAVWYWVAQFVGAVLAAALLKFALGTQAGSLGATTLANGVSPLQGVVIEAILTFFLVVAVWTSGVIGKNGNVVGSAIGWVLTMDILMGGSLTGASMNPARTLGPAIISGNFADIWVYFVGPLVGGAVAMFVSRYLHS
jgi:MIP family channel proteins